MRETKIPDYLKRYLKGRGTLTHQGEVYSYLIIDPELTVANPGPSMFIIGKGGVLAISENYPADFRELGLIHEIIEFSGPQSATSCFDALQEELRLAKEKGDEFFGTYTAFRMIFFARLITFYDGADDFEGKSTILERLRKSLHHLRQLQTAQ